jgi:outer membrane lipoprotein carrier protein
MIRRRMRSNRLGSRRGVWLGAMSHQEISGGARVLGALALAALAASLPPAAVHAQAASKVTSVGEAAVRPATGDPAAVLARARAEYATVRTARAEFTQEIKNPLTARTLQSRGTLLQRKPGRLAVTFVEPAGDRIVSDGTWLWVYIPSSAPGQVLRMPAGEGGTGMVDLAGTVLEAPREGYVLGDAGVREIGGRTTHGVTLTAKAGAPVPFPRATLWVDDQDAAVREVAVTDDMGVLRTIRLIAWEKNAKVDASAFTFTVPAGVRIVAQP